MTTQDKNGMYPMNETKADSRTSGENDRRILIRERNPYLFRPINFRSVTAPNRIMLSPMCQYSAKEGMPNDWHFVHLGARANGGTGIVFTEAVHTEAQGRITPHCLGLWNDNQRDAFKRITRFISEAGAVPGIQLGHAGRKASVGRPWEGSNPVPLSNGGWDVVSASPRAYAKSWPTPHSLSGLEIRTQMESLAASAKRAREAGFQIIELHGAHGYLIHQFLSPLSNLREDEYGGDFDCRARFLFESIDAVRTEWPNDLPLFLRLSVTDWVEGGWSLEDTIRLAQQLKIRGDIDLIDCSSGGNDPRQKIPINPGYQIPLSREVKAGAGIATGAVGLINSPDFAESVLANGDADLVIMGRTLLSDPVWPLRAANFLKVPEKGAWPKQYERSNIF